MTKTAQKGQVSSRTPIKSAPIKSAGTTKDSAALRVYKKYIPNIQKRDGVQSGTFTIDVSAFPTGVYNVNL